MPKILIVEDDNILSKALFEALKEDESFEIEVEVNGGRAFQRIKERKPDLILLDLFLPEKPGEAVLAEIRGDEDLKNIPVLIATVKADKESRERCEHLGISGYFVKSHHALKEIVEEAKKILTK